MQRFGYPMIIAIGLAVCGTGMACGEESQPAPSTKRAIERALVFLKDDAAKWRAEHDCSTCHHGVFTVWTMTEARRRGFAVSAENDADIAAWAKKRWLDRADLPRDTRPGWSMVNTPLIYFALMTRWNPGENVLTEEEFQRVTGHLLRHQEADGSWAWSSAPPANRPPPFFESDEVATRLALLALPEKAPSETDDVRASRDKAVAWLTKSEPNQTTQAAALRLLWNHRTGSASLKQDIERFLSLQRDDGGWGQLENRPSDAYATGQSLYVLNLVGIPPERDEIRRAAAFLVSTQREDGSWPMTRRGHEGVTPSDNIVPITYFGSAWATLGLIRSWNGE
jgi:hypothetical protein